MTINDDSNHKAEQRLNEQRIQLAKLCKSPKTRTATFTSAQPTEWNPGSVINPETGMGYTEPAAWYKIAELLESGCPIEVIPLHKPLGKNGYVIRFTSQERVVYIKLQFGNHKVIGRSFHYSHTNF